MARRRGGRGEVREAIRRDILRGALRPGAKLLQQRLAERFGVAQGVVRESLLELAALGLVETVDNRGMFVAPLDGRRVLEVFEIREVLEGLAARLCCRRAGRESLAELRGLVERIRELARLRRTAEAAELDRRFHHRLVELSGNRMLARLTEQCRALGSVKKMDADVDVVHRAHRRIVEALEKNLPDEAERRTREHVRSARAALEERLKAEDFKSDWIG